MTSLSLIIILAAIGINISIYLIRKRIASEKPVCFIGEDCSAVLDSKYNKLFIIHNDVLGLIGYVFILVLAGLIVIGFGPIALIKTVLAMTIGAAALVSVIFTFIQWRIIKAWCLWCLMSAVISWVMGIVVIFGFNFK